MSTRSFIGKLLSNNRVVGIYCHWDGDPTGVGETLEGNYMDLAKIDTLLALGSISSLGPEIGEKHDLGDIRLTFSMGWTSAYHRDRNDKLQPLREYESLADMEKNVKADLGVVWAYVWIDDCWKTISL